MPTLKKYIRRHNKFAESGEERSLFFIVTFFLFLLFSYDCKDLRKEELYFELKKKVFSEIKSSGIVAERTATRAFNRYTVRQKKSHFLSPCSHGDFSFPWG